jgi:sugar/nucleoside kinase (ribokinase family)
VTAPRFDVVTVGSITLFDHLLATGPALPQAGETALLDLEGGATFDGGCGMNQAMALATLGVPVATAMVCGEDFGESGYAARATAAGVDVSAVEMLAEGSGHCYLIFDDEGRTICICENGASRRQGDHRPPQGLLAATGAAILNIPFDAYASAAARIAAAAGAMVVASGQLLTAGPEVQRQVLGHCTHISCNWPELEGLLEAQGIDRPELLGGLRGAWVTAGGDGVDVLFPDGRRERVPAVPVERLVDPTGAGDAFVAAATAATVAGCDPVAAARLGSTVASFVVEREGAQTNLPTPERLAERYRDAFGGEPPALLRGSSAGRPPGVS